jgi:hypothetical protein
VQAARERVGAAAFLVELAARVQPREHHFHRRRLLDRMRPHGNAASIVLDAHRPVGVQRDGDELRVAAERLVGGVVDHFLDDVEGTVRARVHAGRARTGSRPLRTLIDCSSYFIAGGSAES